MDIPLALDPEMIVLTWIHNDVSSLYRPDKDFDWLNWVMLGSVIMCIPLMIFYKEHYNRLDLDVSHPIQDENGGQDGSRHVNVINGDVPA